MTGKAKIEALTNSWYGFAVFSAVFALFERGLGIWSLGRTIAGLLFSWFVTFMIGRALVNKSSLTRAVLILVSGLLSFFGTLAAARTAWTFVHTWELGLVATVVYASVSAWMNVKSFRTLTDSSVKAYFG